MILQDDIAVRQCNTLADHALEANDEVYGKVVIAGVLRMARANLRDRHTQLLMTLHANLLQGLSYQGQDWMLWNHGDHGSNN